MKLCGCVRVSIYVSVSSLCRPIDVEMYRCRPYVHVFTCYMFAVYQICQSHIPSPDDHGGRPHVYAGKNCF